MFGGSPPSHYVVSAEEYSRLTAAARRLYEKALLYECSDRELAELDMLVELICEYETR